MIKNEFLKSFIVIDEFKVSFAENVSLYISPAALTWAVSCIDVPRKMPALILLSLKDILY